MRNDQIESWALDVIDRVKAREPTEDSRVELKATWIDAKKAARRIAGHANSARGQPILWLIGVDEKAGLVTGAEHEELANWYARVKAEFDGLAPGLTDLNVPVDDKTVVVLVFETDRPPYLVRTPNSGPVQLEVPWREGTAVRSATRSDLLRLLSPLQTLPTFEVLEGTLEAAKSSDLEPLWYWNLWLKLWVEVTDEKLISIPVHRCKARVEVPGYVDWTPFESMDFSHSLLTDDEPHRLRQSPTINATRDELLAWGPGTAIMKATMTTPPEVKPEADAYMEISVQPANFENTIAIRACLTRIVPIQEKDVVRWAYRAP